MVDSNWIKIFGGEKKGRKRSSLSYRKSPPNSHIIERSISNTTLLQSHMFFERVKLC